MFNFKDILCMMYTETGEQVMQTDNAEKIGDFIDLDGINKVQRKSVSNIVLQKDSISFYGEVLRLSKIVKPIKNKNIILGVFD